MGNKVSATVQAIYDNNHFLSLNFKGLEHVDNVSNLLVFGFVRMYGNREYLNIPYNITCQCLLFYYNEHNLYSIIKSFDKNGYDKTKWSLSNNNATIIGIDQSSVDNRYCVYCLDENNKSIKIVAIRCINGEGPKCCIGITSEYRKDWTTNGNPSLWPRKGTYYRLDGERHWNTLSAIILKLDLLNHRVSYYKQGFNHQHIELIKEQSIKPNIKYYVMLCGVTRGNPKLSIISCDIEKL